MPTKQVLMSMSCSAPHRPATATTGRVGCVARTMLLPSLPSASPRRHWPCSSRLRRCSPGRMHTRKMLALAVDTIRSGTSSSLPPRGSTRSRRPANVSCGLNTPAEEKTTDRTDPHCSCGVRTEVLLCNYRRHNARTRLARNPPSQSRQRHEESDPRIEQSHRDIQTPEISTVQNVGKKVNSAVVVVTHN